ncbi:MAG: hypothetical protein AAF438_23415 [Pseudomonadota bacterium]
MKSRLGQPLEGSIDIHAAPGEQIFAACFHVQGVEVPVQQKYFGDVRTGKLVLSSRMRVREPLLNLRLTVTCPELPKTVREFAVFLDPPKSDRPRFAERPPVETELAPPPVRVTAPVVSDNWRPQPTLVEPKPETRRTPVVVQQTPVKTPKTIAPEPISIVRAYRHVDYNLKLTPRLSGQSKNLIARSERQLVPKTQGETSNQTGDATPVPSQVISPSLVIDSGAGQGTNDQNTLIWAVVIIALLGAIGWMFLSRSGRHLGAMTHRDAVDWLANRDSAEYDREEIIKNQEPRYIKETVDFEVQDLSNATTLVEKGGHTIELDMESTRQLEESYYSELTELFDEDGNPKA